jgi:hypothetical protein
VAAGVAGCPVQAERVNSTRQARAMIREGSIMIKIPREPWKDDPIRELDATVAAKWGRGISTYSLIRSYVRLL